MLCAEHSSPRATFYPVRYPLYWPRHGMPHGYLCAHPVHVIYRLYACLPVGPLRELTAELTEALADLRKLGVAPTDPRYLELLAEQQLRYDDLLDAQDQSKYLLADPRATRIVLDSWAYLEQQRLCRRIAITVMGNHVHAVLEGWPGAERIRIGDVLKRHKTFTDHEIKAALGHEAFVWAWGFFDRYVRPGRLGEVVEYVVDNPSKAGLIRRGEAWAGTYVA